MRILNYGSDYAHERKLQKEKESKNHVGNSSTSTSIIPEEFAGKMERFGHNNSEGETETKEKETEEKNETKRGRKPKGKV